MIPLHRDPHHTFPFADVRVVPGSAWRGAGRQPGGRVPHRPRERGRLGPLATGVAVDGGGMTPGVSAHADPGGVTLVADTLPSAPTPPPAWGGAAGAV